MLIFQQGLNRPYFLIMIIQLKGGTHAALSKANPILADREIMAEVDTGKIKIGDGKMEWNSLPYSGGIERPLGNDGKFYAMKNGEWVEISND